MTWTLSHTIADSGGAGAQAHNAYVYLMDTYLASKGWTVGAHPDASTFKRKMSYTFTNEQSGSSYTAYYWATWGTDISPSTFYFYGDQTYTTAPGDLCTATTSYTSMTNNTSSHVGFGQDWKFWTSDQNANAALVTRGAKIWFYWPGFSSAFVYEDTAWDGTTLDDSTIYLPMTSGLSPQSRGGPIYGGSTSAVYNHPSIGASGVITTVLGGMFQGFELMFANSSSSLDSYSSRCYSINQSDVLLLTPNKATTTRLLVDSPTNPPIAYKIGTKYYLGTRADRDGGCNLMFDFGTSEPDFS